MRWASPERWAPGSSLWTAVRFWNRTSPVSYTHLNPVYTIGNQLIEALKAHDKGVSKEAAAKRAMEMLELVGINNVEKRMKQYPHELSGGMRQRVMIAMGLILSLIHICIRAASVTAPLPGIQNLISIPDQPAVCK